MYLTIPMTVDTDSEDMPHMEFNVTKALWNASKVLA